MMHIHVFIEPSDSRKKFTMDEGIEIIMRLHSRKNNGWNPYIADTIGELCVGRYRGLAVSERGFNSTR